MGTIPHLSHRTLTRGYLNQHLVRRRRVLTADHRRHQLFPQTSPVHSRTLKP